MDEKIGQSWCWVIKVRAKRPRLQELIGIVAKWMMGEKDQEESEKTPIL